MWLQARQAASRLACCRLLSAERSSALTPAMCLPGVQAAITRQEGGVIPPGADFRPSAEPARDDAALQQLRRDAGCLTVGQVQLAVARITQSVRRERRRRQSRRDVEEGCCTSVRCTTKAAVQSTFADLHCVVESRWQQPGGLVSKQNARRAHMQTSLIQLYLFARTALPS